MSLGRHGHVNLGSEGRTAWHPGAQDLRCSGVKAESPGSESGAELVAELCSPLKVKVLHYKGEEEEAEADLRLGDIYSRAFHGQVEIGADPGNLTQVQTWPLGTLLRAPDG